MSITLQAHPHRIARHMKHRGGSLMLAVWLAVCLVGTQIAGLGHRIEHPAGDGRLHGSAHQHEHGIVDDHAQDGDDRDHGVDAARDAPASGQAESASHVHAHDDGEEHSAHHCAAYDAASLGDAPPLQSNATTRPMPVTSGIAAKPALRACGPTRLAFHARAPPRA